MTRFCSALIAATLALSSSAFAEEPERDDPRGRMRANEILQGVRTPEAQLEILRIAQAEAARTGIGSLGIDQPVRAPGSAWVNLGPTSADFEKNGGMYFKVDSGRARNILVDPRDPNVVYFATAGGGVWKTYDALDATARWQPITDGVGSLSIGALAMNPANADSLLLGLGDPFDVHTPGFLHSDDGGRTWSQVIGLSGSYPGSGLVYTATSVRDIKFDPSGSTVLVATDAGLFRATDGGAGPAGSWNLVDLSSSIYGPQECWSLAFVGSTNWLVTSVTSPNAASGVGQGHLWRSTDNGASWAEITVSAINSTKAGVAGRMTLASAGARAYLLAEDTSNGHQLDVFRSMDGGATAFTSLGVNSGRAATNPIAGDQEDLDLMHDQAFYNHMILVDPQSPDRVFVGGNLCMARSSDGGTTWDLVTHWLPGSVTAGVWPQSTYVHADWHTATIARSGGKAYFYGGTDGGIFRSVDDGTSGFITSPGNGAIWEDGLNKGMVTHLIYSVETGAARAPTAACGAATAMKDIVYGGFQDNGTRLRGLTADGKQTVFNQVAGGDGFGVGIGCDGASPGAGVGSGLISTYAHEIRSSKDGGATFTQTVWADGRGLTPPLTMDSHYTFVMRIASDLADAGGTTYVTPLTDSANPAAGYVYRSTDGGFGWLQFNSSISLKDGTSTAQKFPHPLKNIAADPLNAGHYGVVSTRRAYTMINGDAASWMETNALALTGTGVFLQPQTIALDPTDPNMIWVGSKATAMSDGSAVTAHLYVCTTARVSNPPPPALPLTTPVRCGSGDWTPKTNGLPNVPINVVKLDPGDHNTIYVGTEIGLYRSTDAGASFSRYGSGLPLVSVTDLSVAADGSSVRIATYGRGFWEISPVAGGSVAGVYGTGDFDGNQQIDGFDLVRESAVLLTDSSQDDYNATGNLVGTTNSIDGADLTALLGKLGGRP